MSGLKHKDTFLVVLVLTAPKNQERRNVIRQTWANIHKKLRDQFLLYFILGNSELSDESIDSINDEKAKHKDILALPMVDSYQALTSKLLASFVQLNRNVKFKVRNIWSFFSSRSLKMRENILVLLSWFCLVCVFFEESVFVFQFLNDKIHNYVKNKTKLRILSFKN